MNILNLITGNALGGAAKLVESGTRLIDQVYTSDKEKEEAKRQLLQIVLQDKQSAREMFKSDNKLQKLFALVFLVMYLITTVAMVWFIWSIAMNQKEVADWIIALVSTIYGYLNAKISTITDFLFGSSSGSSDKNELLKNLSQKQ